VRRRFHALLGNEKLHLILDSDRFSASTPITLKEDLSEIRFRLESDNHAKHLTRLNIAGLRPGPYSLKMSSKTIASFEVKEQEETTVDVPIDSDTRLKSFVISQ
jgi:hypothetical protein